MADQRPWPRRLRHVSEAAALYAAYGIVALLPFEIASAIGGWLGRRIGPYLPPSEIARRNLVAAFPEKSAAEIEGVLSDMWDNLGRVACEYPHTAQLHRPGGPIEVVGAERLDRLRDSGKIGVLFAGHLGNWEVIRPILARQRLPVVAVYRAANNPWVDRLFGHGRRNLYGTLVPKGSTGARMMLAAVRSGQSLAVLVDQKMNDGIAVPFFGRPAMTATAAVEVARRFGCPIVPIRVERLEGARFRLTVEESFEPPRSEDRHADILAGATEINRILESWIRARPEQWLWVHRRWSD